MRENIINFMAQEYHTCPEYLWRRYPTFAVFRHADNRKWFAIVMTLPRTLLGLPGAGAIDIMNVKTDCVSFLLDVPGILPAYHMNKKNWVSIMLDGTIPQKNIEQLIKNSYSLTEK